MRESPPEIDLSPAAAEGIALRALAFLACDMERLSRFLALTGLNPKTIRETSRAPGFLVAVLDHMAGDDSLILAFAADMGLNPAFVARARDALAPRRG